MASGRKCKNCGGSDIEVDPARGDAVCTNCGSVLEDSIIVAEVQFEEGAHGTSSAIGQFVSAESKGGATKFGASFHVGGCYESRELTLRRARSGIQQLCSQLRLNQHCTDTACNFFKMALSRNLTRGRKNTHVHAACVYLTCRTEGTEHLLIDISDVLQICCYELGRTYLRLAQALSIKVPSIDPCLYIMRFAAKLQFGGKTQQVANTALRLVQRMKRDSIHSGRRPSGLCGAALLIASRLHDFGRSPGDIVKIVKVHESTLKKRLMEFGDTPTSSLTLDEFMTIDLEEEQDPPSFKAARKKDKERLQKLMEEEADNFTDLQREIERQLEKDCSKRRGYARFHSDKEIPQSELDEETEKFIEEQTLGDLRHILRSGQEDDPAVVGAQVAELGPDVESMGLVSSLEDTSNANQSIPTEILEDNLDDIDDAEIDAYIMSEKEIECKSEMWLRKNADYLEIQKVKAAQKQKELEEGKHEKKRKRCAKKKSVGPANSAGEAIEKILQEKRISSKINYDVLKSLNAAVAANNESDSITQSNAVVAESEAEPSKRRKLSVASNINVREEGNGKDKRKKKAAIGSDDAQKKVEDVVVVVDDDEETKVEEKSLKDRTADVIVVSEEELEEYEEDEEPTVVESSVLQMLRQHREDEGDNDDNDDDNYDYEDY